MIQLLEYSILKILKLLKICIAISIIFSIPQRRNTKKNMVAIAMIIVGAIIEVFFLKQNTGIIFLMINFLIVILFYSSSFKFLIKSYLLCYLVVEAADSIMYTGLALLSGLSIDIFTSFDNKLADILFTLPSIVFWLIIALLLKRRKGLHLDANTNVFFILLFGILMATFQITFVTYFIGGGEHGNIDVTNWIVLVLMVGSTVSIFFSILYVYKLSQIEIVKSRELEMMRKKDAITRDYYLYLLSKNEEIRAFQHDLKHLMKLTREYIVDGREKEALKVLDNMCDAACLDTDKIVYSQNKVVDATINGVLGKAIRDKEVIFEYKGLLPHDLGVSEVDLCALLSNLLENAYESTKKCDRNRTISMTSSINGNLIIFDVKNGTVRSENDRVLETSKKDYNHGYGISNIYRIVKKYNGEYSYEIEGGIFTSFIILEGKVDLTEKKSG